MMNENLREASTLHNRTVRDKNAEIRRLEIANARLVEQCAEYERKYVITSTLMRRFARVRSINRWADRIADNKPGYTRPRKPIEFDRHAKALADKPWEVVTDL